MVAGEGEQMEGCGEHAFPWARCVCGGWSCGGEERRSPSCGKRNFHHCSEHKRDLCSTSHPVRLRNANLSLSHSPHRSSKVQDGKLCALWREVHSLPQAAPPSSPTRDCWAPTLQTLIGCNRE